MCVIHVRKVQNHPLHTVWQRRRLCDLILNNKKEWSAYGTLSAAAVTAAGSEPSSSLEAGHEEQPHPSGWLARERTI